MSAACGQEKKRWHRTIKVLHVNRWRRQKKWQLAKMIWYIKTKESDRERTQLFSGRPKLKQDFTAVSKNLLHFRTKKYSQIVSPSKRTSLFKKYATLPGC